MEFFPFQPLVQLVIGCLALACAWHVRRRHDHQPLPLVRDFFFFFLFFGFFFFLLSLPGLISGFNPIVMAWGWITGHLFLFLAVAFFIRIPLRLRHPSWMNPSFALILAAGYVFVLLNIFNLNEPTFNGLLIDWNVRPLVGAGLAGVAALVGIIGGWFFLHGRRNQSDPTIRRRSQLLGWGVWFIVVAGMLLYIAAIRPGSPSLAMIIAGDVIELAGIFLLFIGIQFIHPKKR